MASLSLSAVLLFVVVTAEGKLPSFITPCRVSDPEFLNCARNRANDAIPRIFKGNGNFKVMGVEPNKITEVSAISDPSLQIKLLDILTDGLEALKVIKVNADFENDLITVECYIEKAVLSGSYEMDGEILKHSIKGHGPFTLQLSGANIIGNYGHDFFKEDGVLYARVSKMNLTTTTKKTEFHFENLFNGDKMLGNEMNKFLNENWKEVNDAMSPHISEVFKTIWMSISNGLLESSPFGEILPS